MSVRRPIPILSVVALALTLLLGPGQAHAAEPIVTMKTSHGDITLRLYPESAPKACENFLGLIEQGFYDGLVFHRVEEDFVIQGGDPDASGYGGKSIWGKAFENEIDPTLAFDRPGVLAMANRGKDTNTSQFFITLTPAPWLDGRFTIFGEVVAGLDVVRTISELDVNIATYRPIKDAVIESMSVTTRETIE